MTPMMLNAVIIEIGNVNKLENGEDEEKPQHPQQRPHQHLEGLPAAVAVTRMFKKKE